MKIPFYILGLLMTHGAQHGYNIKQIISNEIADFTKIKLPTIYYHLEELRKKEYVNSIVEKDGNRPEKIVYSITTSGIEHFNKLLKKILQEEYCPEFQFDGVLYFSQFAEAKDIIENLNKQRDAIKQKLEKINIHKTLAIKKIPDKYRVYSISIFNHHIYHLEAELKWITETLKEL